MYLFIFLIMWYIQLISQLYSAHLASAYIQIDLKLSLDTSEQLDSAGILTHNLAISQPKP